ncbi:NADP-dependent oxidoreductase (plasmid) [Streptomyces sp. BI20]|uniref:NADP-dependent oxidoreductase n=1 Tax=Streptomyces sp. BI20 TaxID=3403460 RepID=UPI003C70D5C4
MKAVVFEEFGGPEVLKVTEVETPEPGAGQVRVRVWAAGVNPADLKIRAGFMEAVFPTRFPATPGLEFAGVVDAVGPGVTGLAPGDEVLGWTRGGGAYAEYLVTGADLVTPKPAGLDWPTAAALPVATETAHRALGLLGLRAGETLIVHGAAGAVGSVAVQDAVAAGLRVVGTARADRHAWVRSLGALPVAYGEGLEQRVREALGEAAAGSGAVVDAAFDAAGHGALPALIALRGDAADRVVTTADPAAAEFGVPFSAVPEPSAPVLAAQALAAAEGRLRVLVAETFALADAASAQHHAETAPAAGKLILVP